MKNETMGSMVVGSSEQELYRLIVWTKDNPQDWNRICNPESFHWGVEYTANLVERLYEEKLFTVIYFVLYTNRYEREIDWVITRTINECFPDTSVQVLMERFRKNLEIKAGKMEQLQG